jgi:Domain of unknown function (DUF4158)
VPVHSLPHKISTRAARQPARSLSELLSKRIPREGALLPARLSTSPRAPGDLRSFSVRHVPPARPGGRGRACRSIWVSWWSTGRWLTTIRSWSTISKRGATKLGFALLLKFYTRYGQFPAGRSDLPDEAVDFVAGQVNVPASELQFYGRAARSSSIVPRSATLGVPGVQRLRCREVDDLAGSGGL